MIKLDKSLAVRRITPADGHYFFGYYDIQPFSANGKYHLVHKTDFRNRLQKLKAQVEQLRSRYALLEHLV